MEVLRLGPWGSASYYFFDQCPHRMACAKCGFDIPKGPTRAQLLEGKANLQRMRQEIPLSDAEIAAVEDGLAALGKLLDRFGRCGHTGRSHASRARHVRTGFRSLVPALTPERER